MKLAILAGTAICMLIGGAQAQYSSWDNDQRMKQQEEKMRREFDEKMMQQRFQIEDEMMFERSRQQGLERLERNMDDLMRPHGERR